MENLWPYSRTTESESSEDLLKMQVLIQQVGRDLDSSFLISSQVMLMLLEREPFFGKPRSRRKTQSTWIKVKLYLEVLVCRFHGDAAMPAYTSLYPSCLVGQLAQRQHSIGVETIQWMGG